jgi:hypothetical protein
LNFDFTLLLVPQFTFFVFALRYSQLYLWNCPLSFAEVDTFQVQNCRQKINEEETNHCAIDTNDIIDIYLKVSNNKAHSNEKDEVE